MKNKWLFGAFILIALISVGAFIYFKGYEGMFNSFKKDKTETVTEDVNKETNDSISDAFVVIPDVIAKTDTVDVYHLIVGSFKVPSNAENFAKKFSFSDIIILENGFHLVSKSYYFTKEEAVAAQTEGEESWIYKTTMVIDI